MNLSQSAQQMNLDLVAQVGALIGTGFADPDEHRPTSGLPGVLTAH